DGLPAGVTALGLAEACRHPRGQELVRRHLGRYAGDARNAFTALNTAFLDDGAFMHVAPDTEMAEPLHLVVVTVPPASPALPPRTWGPSPRDHRHSFPPLNTPFLDDGAFIHVAPDTEMAEPLHLVFVTVPPASPALPPRPEPLVSHPRNIVIVERGARAAVVESYVALAEGVYWTNAGTELVGGEGARLEYCRVQRESRDAFHVAATHTHQERDSVLGCHPVALGGALSRHDVHTVLAGPGGHLTLNGLYLLGGAQHADHHTVIDHTQPHCESHEYFNG